MRGIEDIENEFIKTLNSLATSKSSVEVFKDFLEMSSISLRNVFLKNEGLEKRFLELNSCYDKKEVTNFPKLFALVVEALEVEPHDFLGNVYMAAGFGESQAGQFFTPQVISELCVEAALPDIGHVEKIINKKGFFTVSDPAAGAGSLIIALAKVLRNKKINYQQTMYASLCDIKNLAAYMAHIQLSLLGIPAEILIGDSLTMKFNDVLYTSFHYLGFWESKLKYSKYKESKLNKVELLNNSDGRVKLLRNGRIELNISN